MPWPDQYDCNKDRSNRMGGGVMKLDYPSMRGLQALFPARIRRSSSVSEQDVQPQKQRLVMAQIMSRPKLVLR